MQSVLILIRDFKYSESRMLIRNMFETALLILYFRKRPYEARRWMDWQNNMLKGKNEIPKTYKEFYQRLTMKEYTGTIKILNKKNFIELRYFKPNYIRRIVFEDHQSLAGSDYDRFSELNNIFSHPTYISLNLNNQYHKETEEDILKTSLFIFVQAGKTFVESVTELIEPIIIEEFDKFVKKFELYLS